MSKTLHPSSVFTQLPGRACPPVLGTPMHSTHRCPTLPYTPSALAYLRRRPEGRGAGQGLPASPHPAAVKAMGPPAP